MIRDIPIDVEVLADAIEELSGERPDELCPAFLVCMGVELGGHAAEVAQQMDATIGLTEALEVYENIDPNAIWADLVKRRTFKGSEPFKGLLRAEVWSACWWHLESMRQLQEVGLCDVTAQDWEWCRTLYETRRGEVFEIRHDGECCWRTEKSKEVQKMQEPVLSKIRRDLVVRPADGRLLDPRLKAAGWSGNNTNLRRLKPWDEHSREKRARAIEKAQAHMGPELPKLPHRWGPSEIEGVERCRYCSAARWLAPGRTTVYRYAEGDRDPAEIGAWGRGRRVAPRCRRPERS